MSLLRPTIDAIAKANPELSSAGWRWLSKDFTEADFRRCREAMLSESFDQQVLDTIVDVGSRRVLGHGSYGLKHRVEARCGRYVSNGAAIVAMLLLGYEAKRDSIGPNCVFVRRTEIAPHPAYRGPNCHRYAGR